jgi:hypothetical protein
MPYKYHLKLVNISSGVMDSGAILGRLGMLALSCVDSVFRLLKKGKVSPYPTFFLMDLCTSIPYCPMRVTLGRL